MCLDDYLLDDVKKLNYIPVGLGNNRFSAEWLNDRSGENISKNEILDHCRKHLTAYKVPKLLEIVDEIPKSNVGKILRRKLREKTTNA